MKNTEELLVESALLIFSEKGYHSTRISDIVKNAGVSQGTYYLYFKNKEDIFIKLVDQFLDRILHSLEQLSSELEEYDDITRLKKLVYHAFDFFYTNRKFAAIAMAHHSETPAIHEVCQKHDEAMEAFIRKIIRTVKPYNEFNEEELSIASSAIFAIFSQLNHKNFNEKNIDKRQIDRLSEVVIKMLVHTHA
ncbi:TetR/AcrR family transcriptional regulator [Bacillus sp. Marseille-P3661]|uniref:TetR/AcrR family transcriptional regulator n=1 Tax=Bacillus sp. Marseille-P3661 TaxID=1936234 RepID=UPI0015E177CF|nr:TetR/AcrR family transcriptional regulator [Bacillus sp. Marseille-P3661]